MKRYTLVFIILIGIAALSTAQTVGFESFRQEGIASWYGIEFAGKPTASGEIFNPDSFTAAHPTLPFGTLLTVTNTQNMRRVTVRVNDRGPFVAARIIDLSKAAAEVLDMINTGTAPVTVELAAGDAASPVQTVVVQPRPVQPQPVRPQPSHPQPVQPQPAHPQPGQPQPVQVIVQVAPAGTPAEIPSEVIYQPSPAPIPAPAVVPAAVPIAPPQVQYMAPPAEIKGGIPPVESTKLYRLQVGAYKVPRNAVETFDRLKGAGLNPAYEQLGEFYRVVLAGLRASEIPSVAQTLGNAGFREAIIREEN